MNRSRARSLSIRVLLTLFASLFFLVIVGGLARPAAARCLLVKWSAFEEISDNIFVDPSMSDSAKQRVVATITEAQERVADLYGERQAKPVIIAGYRQDVMKTYGGSSSLNSPGLTRITAFGAHIVVGPGGINTDVLAHELAHAEFVARVGYWQWRRIPNWFDEGLAVQVDYRYPLLSLEPDQVRSALSEIEAQGRIRSRDRAAYLAAKQEVARWLSTAKTIGLARFLRDLQGGAEFYSSYHHASR